jgi:hypothetical protein
MARSPSRYIAYTAQFWLRHEGNYHPLTSIRCGSQVPAVA